jgi:hypothetical protein
VIMVAHCAVDSVELDRNQPSGPKMKVIK